MSPRKATGRSGGRSARPSRQDRQSRKGRRDGPGRSRDDRRAPESRSKGPSRGRGSSQGSSAAKRTAGGEQVEGRHAVLELLLAGTRKVSEVWIDTDVERSAVLDDIRELAEAARVPVREVGRSRFAARARCEAPQGVIAFAAPLPERSLEALLRGGRRRGGERAPFLVALDGVTDPGNLGAVLRSAECAGATGAILPRHRAVNVTPAAAKAAAGAIEHVPVALVGGLPSALAELTRQDVLTIGLDSAADGTIYDLPPVDGPLCLVLGAEGRGLSRLVRQRCDVVARIPLHGQLASLNVSAAAAVACFELARRREVRTAG